ncbi:MAG: UDP-N-acetylmuramate--L-alanine ligase [Candidatus Doudnabacteria bacterium]|nr:UDP-N-acetylmuramate--L-alanine ligase [Candidatus Doudnabacteria bacterium]
MENYKIANIKTGISNGMDVKKINRVHFVGIGGIGVSALGRLFLAMGKKVTGSDLRASKITQDLERLGAVIFIGHSQANIRKPELVVYSEDVAKGQGIIEVEIAKQQNIQTLTYAQTLGLLMEGKFGVAVSGTNGKSTTTAMLGLILDAAGFDPTVVIGTKLSSQNENDGFQANARLGDSKIFVAEADEYFRHMLNLHPSMIILTNVAEDHLDYYRDLAEIKEAFTQFVKSLPDGGVLIYNADDEHAVQIGRAFGGHKFTFGIHHYADLQAMNMKVSLGKQSFDLHYKDHLIGKFELAVPGKFNVSNALGAVLAAIRLGADVSVIEQVLKEFAGTWRRFEILGKTGKATIVTDYGHHPAAITATLSAAKEFYPQKKILLVFQPHHRNRTQKLFGDFVEALRNADDVIIPEIFDVAGREHGEDISSANLVSELTKLGVRARFAPNLAETENMARQEADNFDMIIFMGAGDIDQLARKIAHG